MVDDSKILFIISQPRSGSTLTQKLLSNNPFVDTVSEPWLLLPILSVYRPDLVRAKYNYPIALQGLFDFLEKRNAVGNFRASIKRLILDLYRVKDESQYFIDKSPRYYEILPQIVDLLPNARFLVLKRNPFAVLYSMITTWSGGKIDFSSMEGYCRDFLVAPFRIQEFCDDHAVSENVLELKYESIVEDPHATMKNAYDWLGIPFTDEVLLIGNNEKVKGIFGDDVYRKTPLQTITSENAETWRKAVESNGKLLSFFEGYKDFLSSDFLKRFGYPDVNFPPSSFWSGNHFQKFLSQVHAKIA